MLPEPTYILMLMLMVIGWCFGFVMGILLRTYYPKLIDTVIEKVAD